MASVPDQDSVSLCPALRELWSNGGEIDHGVRRGRGVAEGQHLDAVMARHTAAVYNISSKWSRTSAASAQGRSQASLSTMTPTKETQFLEHALHFSPALCLRSVPPCPFFPSVLPLWDPPPPPQNEIFSSHRRWPVVQVSLFDVVVARAV